MKYSKEDKYAAELQLKIKVADTRFVFKHCINILSFEPRKMDLFYSEFDKPKEFIKYNLEYILSNLSEEKYVGITTIILYDSDFDDENITPFFEFSITHTDNKEEVICTIRWVSYRNFDQLINEDQLSPFLSFGYLNYFYRYNQIDVSRQTRNHRENLNSQDLNLWGRALEYRTYQFIAAPTVYFGNDYVNLFGIENLRKLDGFSSIQMSNQNIVEIDLFEGEPYSEENRKKQKKIWETLNVEKKFNGLRPKNYSFIRAKKEAYELWKSKTGKRKGRPS